MKFMIKRSKKKQRWQVYKLFGKSKKRSRRCSSNSFTGDVSHKESSSMGTRRLQGMLLRLSYPEPPPILNVA